MMATRIAVRKTHKLFIGGAFVRSESGRTFPLASDGHVVHIARATRKDVRDAVRVARTAWPAWRDRTAYNRGQIVYRLAEIMESRRDQFIEALRITGTAHGAAATEVSAAIDRIVWYAGWCDKIEQLLSTKNPVGLNHFNVSSPEPTGVVGIVSPREPGLIGMASSVIPAVCAGNCAVVIASEREPLSAVALAESIATADVPPGVINILTGYRAETVPTLAGHMDVNALDLWIADEAQDAAAAQLACNNVKRVRRHGEPARRFWFTGDAQGPGWIEAFMEIKTVWHPAGV
jgi:acyl-CoA reductase-like NAD-dependent aldehyde dehydrogenase